MLHWFVKCIVVWPSLNLSIIWQSQEKKLDPNMLVDATEKGKMSPAKITHSNLCCFSTLNGLDRFQAGWLMQTVDRGLKSWLQSSLEWHVIPSDTWSFRWVLSLIVKWITIQALLLSLFLYQFDYFCRVWFRSHKGTLNDVIYL